MSTIKVTNLQNASAASPAIVLASDSTATLNGLAYPTSGSLSGRNRIINGDMRIDQRNAGASVTIPAATVTYLVDRWAVFEDTDGTMTAQRSTVAPTGFTNSLLFTTTVADASLAATQRVTTAHYIEGFNTADLNWGTANALSVTLSFWVRSSLTGTFGGALKNGGNTRAYPFTYSISAANTWEYKTITVTGDTTGTWLTDNQTGIQVNFGLGVGATYSGTAGSWTSADLNSATGGVSVVGTLNATWQITGVQLELGSTATPFERRSYGQELALCQRYYYKFPAIYNQVFKNGYYESSALYFPVTMRAAPSMSSSGSWILRALNSGVNTGYSGFAYNVSPEGFYLSSTTTNNDNFYSWISGTLIASAEL